MGLVSATVSTVASGLNSLLAFQLPVIVRASMIMASLRSIVQPGKYATPATVSATRWSVRMNDVVSILPR